jgi:hypothetical protein
MITEPRLRRRARKLRRLRADRHVIVSITVPLALVLAASAAGAKMVNRCEIGPFAFCPGADLVKADLHGARLGAADLSRADLVGANPRRAILDRANLILADLRYADLRDVLLVRPISIAPISPTPTCAAP